VNYSDRDEQLKDNPGDIEGQKRRDRIADLALRRIRRSLTVQVLFAMPADPGTGSHIGMM
jgi:hypothetical protein